MIRGITKQLLTAIIVTAVATLAAPAMAKTGASNDALILRSPEVNDGTDQIRRVRMATPRGQAAFLQGLADGLKQPKNALRQARQRGGYYGEGVTFARDLRAGNAQLSPFAAGWMSGALQQNGVNINKTLLGDAATRSAVFQAGVREGLTLARQTEGLTPRGGVGFDPSGGGVVTGNTTGGAGSGGVISPSDGAGSSTGTAGTAGSSATPRGGPIVPNLGNTTGAGSTTNPSGNTNTGGVGTGSNPIGNDASTGTIPGQPNRGGGLNPNPSNGNGNNNGGSTGNNNGNNNNNNNASSNDDDDDDEVGDRFGSGLGGVIDIMSGVITVAGGLAALTAEDGTFMGKLFGGLKVASGLLGGIGGLNKLYGAFSGNYFLPDSFRRVAGYASMLNTGLALFGAFKGALGDIGGVFGGKDKDKEETSETPGKIVRNPTNPTVVNDGSNAAGNQPQVVYVPAGAGGGGNGTPVAGPHTSIDAAAGTGQALNGLYLLNCPTGGSCYLVPVDPQYGRGLQPPSPQVAAAVDSSNGVGGAADAANAVIAAEAGDLSGPAATAAAKQAAEDSCLGYIEGLLRQGDPPKSIDEASYWKTLCGSITLPDGVDADRAKELGEMFAEEAQRLGQAYFTGCARIVGIDKFGEACGGTAVDGVPYWVHARTPQEAHQWGEQQAKYYEDTILLNNRVAANDTPADKATDITVPTRDRVDTPDPAADTTDTPDAADATDKPDAVNPAAGDKGDATDMEEPGAPEEAPTVEGSDEVDDV